MFLTRTLSLTSIQSQLRQQCLCETYNSLYNYENVPNDSHATNGHLKFHAAPHLLLFQDHDSVLVDGTCQIPDPLYKLIGSIVCFYIPLGVMLLTYALTVRLLAVQQQNLGGGGAGWSSGWLGPGTPSLGNKLFLLNRPRLLEKQWSSADGRTLRHN
jgi:hypothetical protein